MQQEPKWGWPMEKARAGKSHATVPLIFPGRRPVLAAPLENGGKVLLLTVMEDDADMFQAAVCQSRTLPARDISHLDQLTS
jgi:hypothetical protein